METWVREKGQAYFDQHRLAKQLTASNDTASRPRDERTNERDAAGEFWRDKIQHSYKYDLGYLAYVALAANRHMPSSAILGTFGFLMSTLLNALRPA